MSASKQKKQRSGGPSGPLAALYNLDAGTERGDAVRAVLADQGIRVRTVAPERIGDPVGAIVGLKGFRPMSKPFDGEAPDCEFMLLSGVSSKQLDQLLAAMRAANASVGCKAQVTQHNRLWPFATLMREVSREHDTMNS